MKHKINRISKSQYLKGVKCPKALWFYRHRPDLKPEITEAQQHLFDTGHEIGELAKEYFKGGVEIEAEYYEIEKAIESTDDAIRQGKDIIFEATALSPDGAFSRIDVLKKVIESDFWDLVEVKASTGVKDYHLDDITFQRYAFANAGYGIRNTDATDPRPDFIASLTENCGDIGSVVVYNQSFEAGINNQLTEDFPAYSDRIDNITERMVDLLTPFRSRWLYHPEMKGSASLKRVLPAFVPELSYEGLAIGDGGAASLFYLSCITGNVSDKGRIQIFQNLKDYCCQDTLAEVKLLDVLYNS